MKPFKKSPLKIVFLILFCVLVILFSVDLSNPNVGPSYDTDMTPIPYFRLSNEKEFPYLERPPHVSVAILLQRELATYITYKNYQSAIREFADVRSCLVISEREKAHPNLLLFDWQTIDTFEDAEVCFFRIASSIRDVEGIRYWLQRQGFEDSEMQMAVGEKFVTASWSTKSKGIPFSSNLIDRLLLKLNHSLSIGIAFDKNNEPIGVSITGNSL